MATLFFSVPHPTCLEANGEAVPLSEPYFETPVPEFDDIKDEIPEGATRRA